MTALGTQLPPRIGLVPMLILLSTLIGCSSAATREGPWDYLALGDSFTRRAQWPELYAGLVQEDLGIEVILHMEAKNGQKTSELLDRMRSDEELRKLIAGAEIITINWSPGGLDRPEVSFLSDNCGGEDNQICLRQAVESLKAEWDEVLDEISALRNSQQTIIRTVTYGTWPYKGFYGNRVSDKEMTVMLDYFFAMNDYIAETAAARGILVAEVGKAFEGQDLQGTTPSEYLQPDRLHLSNEGSMVVAALLRDLGYDLSSP